MVKQNFGSLLSAKKFELKPTSDSLLFPIEKTKQISATDGKHYYIIKFEPMEKDRQEFA
jgi:hypothetical protein